MTINIIHDYDKPKDDKREPCTNMHCLRYEEGEVLNCNLMSAVSGAPGPMFCPYYFPEQKGG